LSLIGVVWPGLAWSQRTELMAKALPGLRWHSFGLRLGEEATNIDVQLLSILKAISCQKTLALRGRLVDSDAMLL
jgi:hypothetical protein